MDDVIIVWLLCVLESCSVWIHDWGYPFAINSTLFNVFVVLCVFWLLVTGYWLLATVYQLLTTPFGIQNIGCLYLNICAAVFDVTWLGAASFVDQCPFFNQQILFCYVVLYWYTSVDFWIPVTGYRLPAVPIRILAACTWICNIWFQLFLFLWFSTLFSINRSCFNVLLCCVWHWYMSVDYWIPITSYSIGILAACCFALEWLHGLGLLL